jgi:hypothetical protein
VFEDTDVASASVHLVRAASPTLLCSPHPFAGARLLSILMASSLGVHLDVTTGVLLSAALLHAPPFTALPVLRLSVPIAAFSTSATGVTCAGLAMLSPRP